jgi:hypothetical protein
MKRLCALGLMLTMGWQSIAAAEPRSAFAAVFGAWRSSSRTEEVIYRRLAPVRP